MNWELDAEHRDFQAVCRTFVDRHVRPAVGEAEALGRVPRQLWKELGAHEIQLEILSRELTP